MSAPYDLTAILDELRDGWPQADIARRYGVSKQLVSKVALKHGLRRKQWTKRPRSTCPGCGVLTLAQSGTCRHCQDRDHYPEPTAADALTDGAWVLDPRRRIQVWEAAS